MQETPVVTVFLRHGTDVLLLRRSDAVGSSQGRWGAVAGHAEGDPDAAAREAIREETGIDPDAATEPVRRGDPVPVADADLDTRWLVHPCLFECETATVEPNEETGESEWVPPTAILRRETVPDLWTSYDRVRPRMATVEADNDHGSAFLSLRALEVLRDEAALAAAGRGEPRDWAALTDLARALVDARPAMPVVANRVDRAVTEAFEQGTPAALERAAEAGLERALSADDDAAATAADRLAGARIATLSRSGTVASALERAEPAAVLVAESRPGGEGIAVAGDLAAQLDCAVSLTTDAAFAAKLSAWDADALLVGADAVFPDGAVRNKVGTRGAAVAAAHEGIHVVAVAASDKVTPDDDLPAEPGPAADLTDDERVAVANPTFDVTPAALVDAVATERGVLDATAIGEVADEHRARRDWRT